MNATIPTRMMQMPSAVLPDWIVEIPAIMIPMAMKNKMGVRINPPRCLFWLDAIWDKSCSLSEFAIVCNIPPFV
jgi:hypothetical protein